MIFVSGNLFVMGVDESFLSFFETRSLMLVDFHGILWIELISHGVHLWGINFLFHHHWHKVLFLKCLFFLLFQVVIIRFEHNWRKHKNHRKRLLNVDRMTEINDVHHYCQTLPDPNDKCRHMLLVQVYHFVYDNLADCVQYR